MKSNHLTPSQVQQLREAMSGHPMSAIITLALATGLRRDELLSLKWQDVDLEKCELCFQNVKTRDWEKVHIPEDVALLLNSHRELQMEAEVAAGLTWVNLDLVFSDRHGEPLSVHQLMKGFHESLDLAVLPRISFHNLRHTVAQDLYNTLKQKEHEHND